MLVSLATPSSTPQFPAAVCVPGSITSSAADRLAAAMRAEERLAHGVTHLPQTAAAEAGAAEEEEEDEDVKAEGAMKVTLAFAPTLSGDIGPSVTADLTMVPVTVVIKNTTRGEVLSNDTSYAAVRSASAGTMVRTVEALM